MTNFFNSAWTSLADQLDDAVFMIDQQRRILRANKATSNIAGVNHGDLIGQLCHETICKTHSLPVGCACTSMLTVGEQPTQTTTTLGTNQQCRMISNPIHDDAGHTVGWIVVVKDVTHTEDLAARLAFSERFLLSVIDTEPECVKLVDGQGNLIQMNPAGLRMIEADDLEQVQGKSIYGLIHPDHRENFTKLTEQVVKEGRSGLLQFAMIGLKGTPRWLESHAVPFVDADGGRTLLLSVTRDITTSRQAELDLARRESELAAIIDALSDAVIFTDLERRIRRVNPAFTRLFGHRPDEVSGRTTRFLYSTSEDFEATGQTLFNLTSNATETAIFEMQYRHGNGSIFSAEALGGAVRDSTGAAIGYVAVVRDISERRRLEEQLIQAQKMESVGQMASGVAHDFNNILTTILSSAEFMLLDLDPKSELRADAEAIEKSALRAAALTSQLLTFSRWTPPMTGSVDFNTVISDVRRMTEETFDRSIAIETRLAADLPPVLGHESQLSQVLVNLCLNARDAMPNGGSLALTSEVRRLSSEETAIGASDPDKEYVVISVGDTGIGMAEDHQRRIFDPFFTTKEPGKGTGLGLSVAYGVAKSHQGFITVVSQPGHGTTLRLFIPASEPISTIEVPAATLPKGNSELILVVDDEATVRRVLKTMLERRGYRTLLATDGTEALKLYRQPDHEIDLVLLDMIMPKMGGRQTLAELHELDPAIRVLMVTGYADEGEDIPDAAFGVIHKPFRMPKLLTAVRNALDGELSTGPFQGRR